ncbi:hypothetical protein ACNI65_02655 [Roseateles sp. So40a]|uniref:hypothetical protein n=1 Tax=Roseateles sp. So40a TaxID=3400226 RepID=UPI003A8945D5
MEMPARALARGLAAVDEHEGLRITDGCLREALRFDQEERHQGHTLRVVDRLVRLGAQHVTVAKHRQLIAHEHATALCVSGRRGYLSMAHESGHRSSGSSRRAQSLPWSATSFRYAGLWLNCPTLERFR